MRLLASLSLPFLFCVLAFPVDNSFSLLHLLSSPANMAHSSRRSRTVPERSRSRDHNMWQNRPTQHHGRQYLPWPEVAPAPRLRKVLAIVDLQAVRPLMDKTHDDSMAATTCEVLLQCPAQHPSLRHFHGVQPAVLHQPTYLVHVGSVLAPVIHGHSLAR